MSEAHTTTDDGVDGGEDLRREDIDTGPLNEGDAENAFLTSFQGADEATRDEGDEEGAEAGNETEQATEGEQHEQDEQSTETAPDAATKPSVGDDATVEVKVGDETHKPTIGQLKRLFGQEAALTRRSQEVATERATVQQDATRAKAVVAKALERAEARAKPYEGMDFWKLSRELDTETFAQLRKDAGEAIEEVRFLREEAAAADETIQRTTRAATATAAQACVQALTDTKSPHHVEGWSPKLYGELLDFAKAQGFDAAATVTDPAAIKLMRMAMLYERGKTVVRTKVTAAVHQPRRPLRPGTAGGGTPQSRNADGAFARLRETGSADDAEDAFMARLRRD